MVWSDGPPGEHLDERLGRENLEGSGSDSDGLSLVPLLRNPAAKLTRSALHWHFPHYARQGSEPSSAIRMGRHKLIEFNAGPRFELYDLINDPGETQNLSTTQPELAEQLRRDLDAWRISTNAKNPLPNPAYNPARPRHGDHWGVPQPAELRTAPP